MKATFASIASKANESIATVDRVLNDRPGVKDRTRTIVLQVAEKLGYFGPQSDGEAPTRMDFIIPAGGNSFVSLLRTHLIEELDAVKSVEGRVHLVDGFDEDALASKLLGLKGQTDAIGLIAIDHPNVSDAIQQLADGGIKIATMVSDIPRARTVGYVGIDNRAAGRLAGYLMGRFLPAKEAAKVAVLIGSNSYRGHEEREMGVRSILSREYSHLTVSSLHEINDDRHHAYEAVRQLLLADRPAAIYNTGSGNQGVARALKEMNVENDVVFVGHDLTSATRTMLLDGTMDAAIDQNPRVEAREVVKLLQSAVRGTREAEYPPRLQVIFKENLP